MNETDNHRSHRRGVLLHLRLTGRAVATTVAFALLCGIAQAEWVTVPVRRQTGYAGVFGEVEDRLAGNTQDYGKSFAYWPHEDVHALNSQIDRSRAAFYLPGGRACAVPPIWRQVGTFTHLIPVRYRNTVAYNLYFVQNGANPGFVVFDELSAFTCEAAIMWERGQENTLNARMSWECGKWMAYYCSLVVIELKKTGYSHWSDLNDFVQEANRHLNHLRSLK